MTEEIIKHHKVKPLSRVHMMDIAKIIRNLPIHENQRAIVRRTLSEYFTKIDPFFQKERFNNIATGSLAVDNATEPYSHYKE